MGLTTERAIAAGRICSRCRLWKPATEFYRSSPKAQSKTGLYPYCKPCHRERCRETYRNGGEQVREQKLARRKEYMARHPDRVAANAHRQNLRNCARRLGISVEDVLQALARQKGCSICGREEPNRRLALDHDHRTGKLRGLLCHNCNQALGKFQDDPALLRKAAAYLEAHHGN